MSVKHLNQPWCYNDVGSSQLSTFQSFLQGASGAFGASGSGAWHSSTSAASRFAPQVQKCRHCRENTMKKLERLKNHRTTNTGPLQMTSEIKQSPSCSGALGINQISIEIEINPIIPRWHLGVEIGKCSTSHVVSSFVLLLVPLPTSAIWFHSSGQDPQCLHRRFTNSQRSPTTLQ